jgi:Fic family protein
MPYEPPFTLTHQIIKQISDIAELVGIWKANNNNTLVPALRRSNRIKTIQASLAIEQNTLSVEQVTAVIQGKTVLGPPAEIQAVHNTFKAYAAMPTWQPSQLDDLLTAHSLLMHGLLENAGRLRHQDVGIYQKTHLVHMAPPASQLLRLITDLLEWIQQTDTHPLIASAAFHYEFEFIHPFSDGNGRTGRLWQTLILSRWQPILAYLPVETLIKKRQNDYYRLLGEADRQSDCTAFISFLLQTLENSLQEAITEQSSTEKKSVQKSVQKPQKIAKKVLLLLTKQPNLSLAEVAQQLDCAVRTVERAVATLKKANKIAFVGPKKSGHWEVKKNAPEPKM